MARIKIEDLPEATALSAKELRNVTGGWGRLRMMPVGKSLGMGQFGGRGVTIQPSGLTIMPSGLTISR